MSRAAWLLLGLSALAALAYGTFAREWALNEAPVYARAALKASAVAMLALLALTERASPLLIAALILGAIGDALLALGDPLLFLVGAGTFLIGHICYALLFRRHRTPLTTIRTLTICGFIAVAIATVFFFLPRSDAFLAHAAYAAVLTAMVAMALQLPLERWIAIAGALTFFVSDFLLTLELAQTPPDPIHQAGLSALGWILYWLGQCGLCIGALPLRDARA